MCWKAHLAYEELSFGFSTHWFSLNKTYKEITFSWALEPGHLGIGVFEALEDLYRGCKEHEHGCLPAAWDYRQVTCRHTRLLVTLWPFGCVGCHVLLTVSGKLGVLPDIMVISVLLLSECRQFLDVLLWGAHGIHLTDRSPLWGLVCTSYAPGYM